MLSTFSVLFPVFALIAAGYISYKTKILGPASARELSRFVIWLALPALLFEIMANANWQTLWQAEFISVYLLGTFVVFLGVLAWRLKRGTHLAKASIEGMAASYANTGYIGFPLMFLVFGAASEIPTALASIIVVSILFGFAVLLIESSLHKSVPVYQRIGHVLFAVIKNPLVIAPIAGALYAMTNYPMPDAAANFLGLLADAASPCALISLGLVLAHSQTQEKQNLVAARQVAFKLTIAKLIVQPLLVAWLAFEVFSMPTQLAIMAVFLAALPTGTGPYMLAEFYKRDALVTAQTVMLSTIMSLITLTIMLQWFSADLVKM